MKPDFVANVMFSILCGMLAIPFLAIGIQGLKTRRPFLTSMRLILDDGCLLYFVTHTVPLLFVFGTHSCSEMDTPFTMCV